MWFTFVKEQGIFCIDCSYDTKAEAEADAQEMRYHGDKVKVIKAASDQEAINYVDAKYNQN